MATYRRPDNIAGNVDSVLDKLIACRDTVGPFCAPSADGRHDWDAKAIWRGPMERLARAQRPNSRIGPIRRTGGVGIKYLSANLSAAFGWAIVRGDREEPSGKFR